MRVAAFNAFLSIIWWNSGVRSVPKYLKKRTQFPHHSGGLGDTGTPQ